ncbi:MAG: STM4012 family radical SAM protein [Methylococcales bacterium]|jgi:oxygen-independent coproporphyrinogen III oxidase|nr:STM4012 family radical SAM protein [Methylococcales bacterium]MBT7444187.1 STM4012 family radical SAM protein [Methylococcales bacterium]
MLNLSKRNICVNNLSSNQDIEQLLAKPIYQAYAYSYPHKTAYRTFKSPKNLIDVWQKENLESLFLYVHIPFCGMRCGFCNLFTLVKPKHDLPDLFLDALSRQIKALQPVIEQSGFARYAIGGGTPTYLSVGQLERLFELTDFNGMSDNTPIGIECSPETVTVDKIQLLQRRGVNRISMGVQSFTEGEVKNLVRRQSNLDVCQSIELIRAHSTADLNLDLIYGIAGQTVASWESSILQALQFEPEELYLYPLYVREKTGLGAIESKQVTPMGLSHIDMLALYRAGRDLLLSEGYEQVSMRMFRLLKTDKTGVPAPLYSCQEDGMLGLGAGARSYTQTVHYSSEYAVGRQGVKSIIEQYVEQTEYAFSQTHYGITLSDDEQKRRFLMQSLLISEGLDLTLYQQRFSANGLLEFPLLQRLIDSGLAMRKGQRLMLTDQGLERADSIGPWFSSDLVQRSMTACDIQ